MPSLRLPNLRPTTIYRFYYSPRQSIVSHRLTPSSVAAKMSTISSAIAEDHRELEEYYNEVINNPGDLDHQQRYGNQFVWELARHSVGEELVVYPAYEKYLGAQGKEMAEHDRKEHHEVKKQLQVFQGMNSSDKDYISTLKGIWGPLKKHMKEEDNDQMPILESRLDSAEEESATMAKSFERTKMFVPTRSHPAAGEHPPFETVMGLLTAPIDHITDLFRKFPNESTKANSSAK